MKNFFQKFLIFVAKIYTATPFFPHWLESKRLHQLKTKILLTLAETLQADDRNELSLLEIGCGSQQHKTLFFELLPISNYIGIEYPVWWQAQNLQSWENSINLEDAEHTKYQEVKEIIFGNQGIKADVWADAQQLPFGEQIFDLVVHFEVMEHIANIELLFSETHRSLKKGGYSLFSVPFMYQNHSTHDISRPTKQGIELLGKKYGFSIETYISTSFGTMMSQFINSFAIKHLVRFHDPQSSATRKVLIAILTTLFVFPITNIIGYLIDKLWFDDNYANHHFFLLKKL